MAEEEATEGEPGGDEGDSSSGGGGDESIDNLDEFLGDDLAFAGNELQDPVAHLWVSTSGKLVLSSFHLLKNQCTHA